MVFTSTLKGKMAIIAPVPESYLHTAINRIYPIYKKVSFGASKVGEIQKIREDFLEAKRQQHDVYVYIYLKGSVQYKALLMDEFLFYGHETPHPNPWGSWNINFKSYYTVKDIISCNIPLHQFKSFLTGNTIENVRRPLRVIDPQ